MHLFREVGVPRAAAAARSTGVCVLAVPAATPAGEIIKAMKGLARELVHFRALRDVKSGGEWQQQRQRRPVKVGASAVAVTQMLVTPAGSHYMVLMNFRTTTAAGLYIAQFNGTRFDRHFPHTYTIFSVGYTFISSLSLFPIFYKRRRCRWPKWQCSRRPPRRARPSWSD